MFDINEKEFLETEIEEVVDTHERKVSDHDFGWESLASVETSRQHQLISEVYSIMNTGDDERIAFIKREWDSLSEEGISQDLEDKFKAAVDQYEHRQERIDSAQKIKKELIEKADSLKNSTEWNKTATALQELQNEWKEAGFAGQDVDQELWEKFRAINDVFFDARSEHFEKMGELRKEAKVIKEGLIEEVQTLKDSTEWKETSNAMRDLMTRWKEAGFAGREYEDQLWEEFNAHRQHFYQQQREFFDALRSKQDDVKSAKEDIVERARTVVSSFNDETTREHMTQLFEEWKTLGHAGREHESRLWGEFRELQDSFFAKLKNRDYSKAENRREEMIQEADTLEVRIDALDVLNEKIRIKLASLEGQAQSSDSETLQEEIKGLRENLQENETKLDEYESELNRLDDALNRNY